MGGKADEPSGRIAGLDLWRTALMLGGLLVHAVLWQEPRPLFAAVVLVSNAFRMGAFFAISGYLAAIVLQRRRRDAWFAGRMIALGVPAALGLATMGPIVLAIVAGLRPALAHDPLPLLFDWHHLWFLAALLLYTPFACLLDRHDAARRPVAGMPARVLLLVVAMTTGVLMALATPLILALAPPGWSGPLANARLIAGYLPMYLLGFLLARDGALRAAIVAGWRAAAAILLLVALGYVGWFAILAPLADGATRALGDATVPLVGAALAPPAAFALILRSALTIRSVPPLVGRLCAASYTIYIVHLPILVAINMGWARVGLDPHLEYALAVVIGGAASFLLHERVVARSPTLLLLLNGKLPASGVTRARRAL